jgi:hypothetical protein
VVTTILLEVDLQSETPVYTHGIGWTMNFVKPMVWVILILLVAAPMIMTLFVV